MNIKRIKHISFLAVFSLIVSGCASTNPWGDKYDDLVMPGTTKILNMTGKPTTDGSAEIYFAASSRSAVMITFTDRLVAVQLDGKNLPEATSGIFFAPTGYQAIAVNPGVHTISYCFTARSTFGASYTCNLKINDFKFEENSRYMVTLETGPVQSGSGGSQSMEFKTQLVKLN